MRSKFCGAFTLLVSSCLFVLTSQSAYPNFVSPNAPGFVGMQTTENSTSVASDALSAPPSVQPPQDPEEARVSKYIGADPRDCQSCRSCGKCPCPDNYLSGVSSVGLSEGNLRDAYQVARVRSAFGATIDLSLHYNSYNADGSRAAIDTVMGLGWTHSYNIFLFSQNGHLFRMDGDGRVTKYQRNQNGTFTAAPGYFETLVQTAATTFVITTTDRTSFVFALIPSTPFAIGDGQVYRLVLINDRNSNFTILSYTNGNLTSIRDTFARTVRLLYDGSNKLISVTDPQVRTTTLEYDSTGRRLLKITDPEHKSMQYSYNSLGQLIGKVDKDGRSFSYLYEDLKPVAIVDGPDFGGQGPIQPRTLFRLTNAQNWATKPKALAVNQLRVYVPATTTQMDGRRNLWRYQYDANGYITRTVAPDGATTTYVYDEATLMLASKTDANNHTTSYDYDAQGNLTSMIDPLGHLTRYTYDPVFSQLTSMTDDNGRTTRYEIDNRGNRTREIDSLGRTMEWTYESHGNVISAKDRNGNLTQHIYDQFGSVQVIVEAAGTTVQRPTIFANSIMGIVVERTNGINQSTLFDIDRLDRVIHERDPEGHVSVTSYNGMGDRTKVIDRNGHSTSSEYDQRQRLVRTIDALNQQRTYSYDNNNNLISMTDRNGHTTRYTYDQQNRRISVIDALNNRTTYTYDGAGNKLTQTDVNNSGGGNTAGAGANSVLDAKQPSTAVLNITRFAYDPLDRLVTTTNAEGEVSRSRYDTGGPSDCPTCAAPTPGSNVVTEEIDPRGNVTLFGFDDRDLLSVEIRKEGDRRRDRDPSDAVTLHTYDANGNPITVRQPNGDTTTSFYNPLNQVVRWSNNAGNTITYAYDPRGKLVTRAESVSSGGTNTLAADDNPDQVVDSCTNVTTFSHDDLDRLTQIRDQVGLVALYSYDDENNRLSETDGNGHTKLFVYDALNRVVMAIDALGARTRYEYDPEGNLIKVIDREAKVTTNTFDALNRRTSTTKAFHVPFRQSGPNGTGDQFLTTNWEYDHAGNVVKITDAKPNPGVTRFEYDGVYRVVRETYSNSLPSGPGQSVKPSRRFTYDPDGNLKTRTDENGRVTTYQYNDLNFLIKRDYPVSADDNMTYDLSGRLVAAERGGWLVTFAHDGAGRLTRSTQNGKTVSYLHNTPCRTRRLTYPGGRSIIEQTDRRDRLTQINDNPLTGAVPLPIARYTYDLGNRVASRAYRNGTIATYAYNANDWMQSLEHSIGSSRIAGFGYTYDKEGNKRGEEKRHDPAYSETYFYDDLYRLINFSVGGVIALPPAPSVTPLTQTIYHLDEVGNWNRRVTDRVTETRQHNAINELTSIDGNPIDYDNNGNQTGDQFYNYEYDEENRLVRVTRKGNPQMGGPLVASYQYDALGRRVRKVSRPFGILFESRYVYDDDRIIEEQNSAGVTQATFVYGNYIDEVVAMNRGGEAYYYHQNALWSVAALTDSTANVVERYAYGAYGGTAILDDGRGRRLLSAFGNPFMFTGREFDVETGLYFYRARYLDPGKGRFTTRDPIGIWGDEANHGNGYLYVGDNPVNYGDPSGNRKFSIVSTGNTGTYGVYCKYPNSDGDYTAQFFFVTRAEARQWGRENCPPSGGRVAANDSDYSISTSTINSQSLAGLALLTPEPTAGASLTKSIGTQASMMIGTPLGCQFSPMSPGCPLHICAMNPSAPQCLGQSGSLTVLSSNAASSTRFGISNSQTQPGLGPQAMMKPCANGLSWWRSYSFDLGGGNMGGTCYHYYSYKNAFSCRLHTYFVTTPCGSA
jgi:RHS repeat-associated protein